MMLKSTALIAGCGYLGQRIASLESSSGSLVTGLVRSTASAANISERGWSALCCDLDAPAETEWPAFRDVRCVYYTVAPSDQDAVDPRLRGFLSRLPVAGGAKRFVYVSTSGVYGDCRGEWVDEERPVNPQTLRAQRRWAAETLLTEWVNESGWELVILRVPGIYGPGRLPIDRIRRGEPVVALDESPFSNRIHVDDLAAACYAAARAVGVGRIYNVSDGHPSSMTDYTFRVADAAGLARPREISLCEARRTFSPMLLSFLGESRRIDNGKMLRDLQLNLQFDDLDRGIRQSLDGVH